MVSESNRRVAQTLSWKGDGGVGGSGEVSEDAGKVKGGRWKKEVFV